MEQLDRVLTNYFGFSKFKGDQRAIINTLLLGQDVFVVKPTGGGKSLCYQLPALVSEGTAIIISPLIALMKNQVDAIRAKSTEDSVAHFMNSSLTKLELEQVRRDVVEGKTKMLYVAPETLHKPTLNAFLNEFKISFVAVDEAHCISEWGHDFRPEYRKIKETVKGINHNIPVIALTATATTKVQSDIMKNLQMTDAKLFKSSFNRPNLFYTLKPKVNHMAQIVQYIKKNEGKSGIIYCLSRKKVEEVAKVLQLNGIKALPYHAGLDSEVRSSCQDQFLKEEVDVIVATIAFGMGIDKPDIRFVIHHDIPKSLESYYQETGRAGRDGLEGECIAFYGYEDVEKMENFIAKKNVFDSDVAKHLLYEVVAYCESAECRRRFILHYFGESFSSESCNKMCDNCRNPKEKIEVISDLNLLISCVKELQEKENINHINNFLVGNSSSKIKQYEHHTLPSFGKGSHHSVIMWNSIIRGAILEGFFEKSIEQKGALKLTTKAAHLPSSFLITVDHDFSESHHHAIEIQATQKNDLCDLILFELLRDLNKKVAAQKNLPPYVVFSEISIREMAAKYPVSLEELKDISGVGIGKAQKFGKPFIREIEQYVRENEILRDPEIAVKSIANKSANKIFIIQSIDRKMTLEDIAQSKGWGIAEVLEQIENIVESGTKINLSYYIDEVLDQEQQEEIFDFFRENEQDCIETALKEFSNEGYTSEDIRLMRIKFLSDFGN